MHELSFDKTTKRFDLIVLDMNDANKKNNLMFRRICKEVFQKSFSKIEFQNNLDAGAKMAGVGIVSAIQMARGKYKEGSFVKSFRKLNNQTSIVSYSDLNKVNQFLKTSDFTLVVKLLKLQYNYGLIKAISVILK
ncbi:hypothetical protein SCCGRSA3_01946 [Marine Group I thaumarchaeote SCGC RSA3]|uniref:Uncharacterized protein n=2 Tax=Marine Group I TaxID=905826 RepID=A0A087RQV0_9ARCH|nr:hypothetical protein AAA799D11_01054 [Marine Group I thaumarchaeote SCGC AAA799-D11]KFM17258.1 hypothetical protein SCCGRSA3_01946 [Marine Group I thaumarchaeote SCGC RSA3]